MAPIQEAEMEVEPEVMDCSPAGLSDPSPLERTQSQLAKHVVVQKVVDRSSGRRGEIEELRRAASVLGHQEAEEPAAAQGALAAVEQEQKRVRNFGEDLLEDMLALDALGGLHSEDRAARRGAIAELDSLLGTVDGAKAKLAAVRGRLQKKLDEAQAEEAREAEARPALARPAAAPTPPLTPGRRPGTAPARRNAPRARPPPGGAAAPLGAEFWGRIRLPVRFQYREGPDGYTAIAALPGVDAKDLELTFSDDLSRLSVAGVRLPSASEASHLQRYLETELGPGLAIRPEHYLEAGRGAFGRFGEELRLPRDVDVDGVTASHERGALRIHMPRRPRLSPLVPGRRSKDLGASMPRWPLAAYPGSGLHRGLV